MVAGIASHSATDHTGSVRAAARAGVRGPVVPPGTCAASVRWFEDLRFRLLDEYLP